MKAILAVKCKAGIALRGESSDHAHQKLRKPLREHYAFLSAVGKTYQRQASIIISISRWKPEEWEAGLEIQQTLQFRSGGLTESMEVICGVRMAGIAYFHPKAMVNIGITGFLHYRLLRDQSCCLSMALSMPLVLSGQSVSCQCSQN